MYKKRLDSEPKPPPADLDIELRDTIEVFFEIAPENTYKDNQDICTISYPLPNDNRPYSLVKIYDLTVQALLDSGSNLTLISGSIYSKLKSNIISPLETPLVLKTASGDQLDILGKLYLPFTFNGLVKIIPTLVVPNLAIKCICGMDFWEKFNIHPTVNPRGVQDNDQHEFNTYYIVPFPATGDPEENLNYSASPSQVASDFGDQTQHLAAPPIVLTLEEQTIIDQIKTLFIPAGEGPLSLTPLATHKIEIKDEWKNKTPVRQFPYVMSPKTLGLVSTELQRLLDNDVIEPSNSDWCLNCVPVIKPNKIRLCLDARKVNERTVRDAYPLPHPGRILGQLPKARYLSTIDLSEAFLQIPLEPDSRKYTAFSVQGKGLFQYKRMPFGLVNSPASLARLMDGVLGRGLLEPNVFVYLDDIVVVTEGFQQHIELLKEIAHRLAAANLSINLKKSQFCVSEIPFLGYLLTSEGLRTNPDKIRPIVEYERPTSVTKLRRFLGMANYYRRFIPDFSGSFIDRPFKNKNKIHHLERRC